ncbi:MAG TPA: hypothetical protein EYH54_03960 [Nautiliaceae bacterium]|nr:hypothetical protein [Nautiliaceae bacterium]
MTNNKDWKNELDEFTKLYLNDIIKETKKFRNAYLKSETPYLAQMWIAISLLNRKIKLLEEKIKFLESKINIKDELLKDLKKF